MGDGEPVMSEHERLTAVIAAQRDIIGVELDFEAMLRLVAERAMSLTGAEGSAVELADADGAVVYRAVAGSLVAHAGLRLPRATSLARHCLESGEVMVCADSELDPRVERAECRLIGARSFIVVALVDGGVNVGVLKVVRSEPRPFAEREVDTLQVMSGLVSGVMSRTSAIQERELKFHAFMDNSPTAAFLKDEGGRYVFVNSAYARWMGRPSEELIGKTVFDLFAPSTASAMAARDREVLSSGAAQQIESVVVEGPAYTWLTVIFPVRDARDRAVIGGIAVDVSARVATEEALRASEHRFRSLAEFASDAVISLDASGVIVFWNQSAVRVFGYDASEAIGRSLSTILVTAPGEEHTTLELFASRATALQATPLELRARRKNGSEFPVEVSVSTWTSGNDRFFTGILRDVTERTVIQEQLSHATRLIAIGTLASGIGHEINNPLSYVMYNLEFACETVSAILAEANQPEGVSAESLQKLLPLRDDLIEASNGADRIRAILRDLRTFSRAGDERKMPTSVRRAADAAINMVWNQIRHHARIVKDYEDVAMVDAVEGKLVQVIVNLLVNAAQATVVGRPEQNTICVRVTMAGERWVILEVSDTGSGIPASDLSRIFDPFYTTKGVGSGTGLGLSISHGIVQSFGGTIEVETELHHGSTFRVRLPASQPVEGRLSQRPRARPSAPPRRARVMVIDDDAQVSASLQRMLAREHEVVAFTSSVAAARELTNGARYDLILCDVMMPELPGWQLYAALDPEQQSRVAFMTGGAFQQSAREFLASVKNPVLDKPIDARQLRALLRECLPS